MELKTGDRLLVTNKKSQLFNQVGVVTKIEFEFDNDTETLDKFVYVKIGAISPDYFMLESDFIHEFFPQIIS